MAKSGDDLPRRDRKQAVQRADARRERDKVSGFEVGNDNLAQRRNRDGGPVGQPSENGWQTGGRE